MDIRKSFLYVFIVTAIGAVATLYVLASIQKIPTKQSESVIASIQTNETSSQLEAGKIGKLNFMYDKKNNIQQTPTQIIVTLSNRYVGKDLQGVITKNNNFNLKINYFKNENPRSLSSRDFYRENAPSNARQGTEVSLEKEISINGIPAFEAIYKLPMAESFGSYFYNVASIYITHGKDEYEFWGYQLPQTPSTDLTADDIAAAHAYEKAFSDILNSIHFDAPTASDIPTLPPKVPPGGIHPE